MLRRRRPPLWMVFVPLGVLGLGLRIWLNESAASTESLAAGEHRVATVLDPTSLQLENGSVVRLIGVRAPTNADSAAVASQGMSLARQALREASHSVRLQFDRERQTERGEFLAFVWFADGNTGGERLLQEELLRAGCLRWDAREVLIGSLSRRLRQAESAARSEQTGLWKRDRGTIREAEQD